MCSGLLNLPCGSFVDCGQEVRSVGLQTLRRRDWVRILPRAMCRVGGGLCEELIVHLEESYLLRLAVYDLEISAMRRPRPKLGCRATEREREKRAWIQLIKAVT